MTGLLARRKRITRFPRRTCRGLSKWSLPLNDLYHVVQVDHEHEGDQYGKSGDVHPGFFLGIDRFSAYEFGDDERGPSAMQSRKIQQILYSLRERVERGKK